MSAAHVNARNRAARIRKAKREGKARASQVAWLAQYDAERRRAKVAREPEPPTDPDPPSPAPPPAPDHGEPERVVIDFGIADQNTDPKNVEHKAAIAKGGGCSIADCPACKNIRGTQICGTTGKRVFPPMSIKAAKVMAGGILGIVAIIVKIFRSDKKMILPTQQDITDLAEAIVEIAHRRFSWLGAFDDFLLFASALGGYAWRAYRDPGEEPLP